MLGCQESWVINKIRALSLAGRAPPWHGGGQEFESPRVHQISLLEMAIFLYFHRALVKE